MQKLDTKNIDLAATIARLKELVCLSLEFNKWQIYFHSPQMFNCLWNAFLICSTGHQVFSRKLVNVKSIYQFKHVEGLLRSRKKNEVDNF